MGTFMILAVLIVSTILSILWFILHIKYKDRFTDIITGIDQDDYQISELFYIGFGFLELLHFSLNTDRARKKIKEISEVRGKQYAKYYYYVMQGAKTTYFLTLLPLVLMLAGLADDPIVLILGVVLCVLLIWHMEEAMKDKLTKRREELMRDFPKMLSKITLLINSGMIMREAWQRVAENGEGVLYQEMRDTIAEQQMGITELDSYANFADRCNVKEIRRFASTLVQNLQKGNAEMTYFLRELTDEMWEFKKNVVKQQGEAANSKLLLPTVMIFIGILAMIMAPMLQNM